MDITGQSEFLEELKLYYDKLIQSSSDNYTTILRSEEQVVNHILNELKWRELPDKQKQAKRKSMVSLLQKWASMDNTQIDLTYELAIIDYYDCAENLLFNLSVDTEDDNLKRLYAMVYIEQYLINEHSRFEKLRHTNYNIYTSLLKSLVEDGSYKWLSVKVLLEKFETMYSYYNNKP